MAKGRKRRYKLSAEGLASSRAKRMEHRARFGGYTHRKKIEAKKQIDYQGAGYDMVFGFDFTLRYRYWRGGSPHLFEERNNFKDD